MKRPPSFLHAVSLRSRPATGFTLIEMLLVVAIISLLIAILLPTVSISRAWARTDQCAANVRILLTAYQNYAHANNKLLVGSNTSAFKPENLADPNPFIDWMASGNNPTSITDGKLYKYVNSMSAYRCPDHVYPWYLNAYSINGMLNGEQVFDGSTSKRHWTRDMRDSQQLVFMEEDDYRGWNINSWMLAGTESFIDLPAANHIGGDNVGFLDGHVEYWAWLDKDLRVRPKHGATGITFGFSDPGNQDWHRMAPVFRSWPR